MSTIFRGLLAPFLQNQSWDWDPQRGQIYRADFKGASQALMQSLAQSYVLQGVSVRLVNNQGDTASLFVEDPTQTYTIDSWQILGNEENLDTWRHPSVIAAGVTKDQITAIRRGLDNHTDSTVLFATAALATFSGTAIQRRYDRANLGSTEFRRGQYVLRHTTNVSNRWTVNVADSGVDSIYTPAQLLTECSNASLWIFPLPPRLQYKLSNIPAQAPQSNFQWGWLKSASIENTSANNRVDISTEFTLYLWSTDDYPPF